MAPKSSLAKKNAKRDSVAPGSDKKIVKKSDPVQKITSRASTAKKEILKLAVEQDDQTAVEVYYERSLAAVKASILAHMW
jgi:hypothetical protein